MKNLNRFLTAQAHSYQTALSEIKRGKKTSHWMWYIFPQLAGLGQSETAKFYAIKDLAEAKEYLCHPILGPRLIEIITELLKIKSNDPYQIFGRPDDLKLKSCLSLFSIADPSILIFQQALDKFYKGIKDQSTLKLLGLV